MFSKRVRNVRPSGTVMLSNKVKRLKKQGLDILSFTLGEPDFTTPSHITEACKKALDQGMTHYTSSLGMPELRQAIARYARTKNGIDAVEENVILMPAKFALMATLQAFINPGDKVIIPNPGWVSYGPMVQMAGGTPSPVKMRYNDGWDWHPEDIRAHITSNTKAIILNTPSNPMGSVMDEKRIREIADIALEHDLLVISDEIYENLIYEGTHFSMASMEEMADRTITVSGFSKSFAMTGWRVGWIVANEETIKMLNKIMQHSLTCIPPFIQMGALAALENGDECVNRMKDEFRNRRDMIIPRLNEIDGISCEKPKGAFYAFFKMDIGFNSMDLAEMLLYKAHVAVTPGSAFGSAGSNYIRMSYAASMENLEEGVSRIKKFSDEITKKT
ncbi:MAG: pyridoxal phosphate-dependent aminotransferase [Thermoplasmatota archaeon]